MNNITLFIDDNYIIQIISYLIIENYFIRKKQTQRKKGEKYFFSSNLVLHTA